MKQQQLTINRLRKEEEGLKRDPIPGVLVQRDGLLDFHFVIYKLDEDYEGGFYHGLLELHPNYPFAAPKLFFYTKNGRFEVNMAICTSFTHYHQESWTSAWNVRSLLLATVSFMTCDESSYGCRNDPSDVKKKYAAESLESNFKNQKFVELFREDLQALGVRVPCSAASEVPSEPIVFHEGILENDGQLEPVLIDNIERDKQEKEKRRRKRIKILVGCVVSIAFVSVFGYYCLTS